MSELSNKEIKITMISILRTLMEKIGCKNRWLIYIEKVKLTEKIKRKC